MYSLPQEIEVWYIIPAIRKELAKLFVKDHKLSYEKAGVILGISKAAVSQYISNKRATKFKLPQPIKTEIAKSAKKLVKTPNQAPMEIEKIIKIIRTKKCSCDLCKKYNPEIIKLCHCKSIC